MAFTPFPSISGGITVVKLKGTVKKIKLLSHSKIPLLYVKINEQSCLVASHYLDFFGKVAEDMNIEVWGYFNKRNQFIIKKYRVLGESWIVRQFL